MMDREDQHVIVGRAAQIHDAIERTLNKIERLREKSPSPIPRCAPGRASAAATSRKSKLIPQLFRIICSGRSLPGRNERRKTSCRSTTRWIAARQSRSVRSPRTSMRQQMWFAMSATGTGEVSHNSRWGKVSGWSCASPLSSHCLRRARLSAGISVASRRA